MLEGVQVNRLTGEHGLSGEFESKRWRTNPRDEARPGTHPHFALPSPHSYSTMATLVIPGQPLSTQGTGAQLAPGPGTFSRNGQLYASLVGEVIREQGVRSTPSRADRSGRADNAISPLAGHQRQGQGRDAGHSRTECHRALPLSLARLCCLDELTAGPTQVIGTVTRITRQAATLSLLTVDGRPCRPDFTGIIRAQDVRQTAKDSVKVRTVARGAAVRGEETDEDPLCFLCRFGRVTGQATSSEPRS